MEMQMLLELMGYGMLFFALVTVILLSYFQLAERLYGRYSENSPFGKIKVPARLAWVLQEVPSVIMCLYAIWQGSPGFLPTQWSEIGQQHILVLMFLSHYVQRTFIFSLSIQNGKPTPIILFLAAMIFCSYNGYMQGQYHVQFHSNYNILDPYFLLGCFLFICGMVINIQCDYILRNLRIGKDISKQRYFIPKGHLFKYISASNLIGEIIEWIGYAIASQSLVAFAFAVYTMSNLAPRAIAHHEWYLKHFGDEYKKLKRARIIPFVY